MRDYSAGGHRSYAAGLVGALVVLLAALAPMSSAFGEELPEVLAGFKQCPRFTPGVNFCFNDRIETGLMTIGAASIAITNPVVFQGGYERNEEHEPVTERFVGAIDGETLSRTPQPIPGGLSKLIDCAELDVAPLEIPIGMCEQILAKPAWSSLTATMELAGPASEIYMSTDNMVNEEGIAFSLPIKIHLKNRLLGGSCYIGSEADPIVLSLTTGKTSPPPPNNPISGGMLDINSLTLDGFLYNEGAARVVDNSFAVPAVTGCGKEWSSTTDPIIDHKLGLPSPAGYNTVTEVMSAKMATAEKVIENETGIEDSGEGQQVQRGDGAEDGEADAKPSRVAEEASAPREAAPALRQAPAPASGYESGGVATAPEWRAGSWMPVAQRRCCVSSAEGARRVHAREARHARPPSLRACACRCRRDQSGHRTGSVPAARNALSMRNPHSIHCR